MLLVAAALVGMAGALLDPDAPISRYAWSRFANGGEVFRISSVTAVVTALVVVMALIAGRWTGANAFVRRAAGTLIAADVLALLVTASDGSGCMTQGCASQLGGLLANWPAFYAALVAAALLCLVAGRMLAAPDVRRNGGVSR